MNEEAIRNLLLAHRHARLAVDAMVPEHLRERRREIRRQTKSLLRLLLLDDTAAAEQPEPTRPTRVTID